MLDLLIISLGFMIHMWALPYSFKNVLFESMVRLVQLAFGVIILVYMAPSVLLPSPTALMAGAGVGIACFAFQLLYNRGVKLRRETLKPGFIFSQLLVLLFFEPAEEIFYRGMFLTRLTAMWGAFTATVLTTALSTMITVVSTRKTLLWAGSAVMGALCALSFYYTQSIWAPILIQAANHLGFDTLNERRSLFQ